jgi:hypothetical protein
VSCVCITSSDPSSPSLAVPVITFAEPREGTLPAVRELRVELDAEAASESSIEFRFKFIKAYLNSFFGFPIFRIFGRPLPVVLPVPGLSFARTPEKMRKWVAEKRSALRG